MPQDDSDNAGKPERMHYSKENLRLLLERAKRARERSRQLLAKCMSLRDRSRKK